MAINDQFVSSVTPEQLAAAAGSPATLTPEEVIQRWFNELICNQGIPTQTYNIFYEAVENLKERFKKTV